MALSKVKQIGDIQRPIDLARNDFNPANEYGSPQSITSPIGRDPNASGQVGTAIDIAQRTKLLAKNLFSASNPYDVTD
jgi:hypothetical protein